jgi:AcrR family transcriptional regulator
MLHPTAQLLVETVTGLLDSKGADQITSEEVLHLSGVSRGSLYHHFEDFDDLVDSALVKRFGKYIAETNAGFAALSLAVHNAKDMKAALRRMTRWAHDPSRAEFRFERIRVFARASEKPSLRAKLALEQDALTTNMAEIIAGWQERGFVVNSVQARSIAVVIQAIVIGRVVDEIADTHVDPEDWLQMMDSMMDMFVAGE